MRRLLAPDLRLAEIAVLVLCLLVRLVGLSSLEQTDFADFPLVDAFTYWEQAQALDAGKDPFAEGLYQPPGYPVFLFVLGQLTGRPDLGFTRWVQLGLGLLTAVMLLRLGRRLGEGMGAPWLGAVAALLFSLYPTTLLFEQDMLTPALTGFLFTLSLTLLWVQAPGPGRAAGAGLVQGLLAVVHPSYLLASVASAGWLSTRGRRAGPLLAFVLALGIAIAPVTWRNLTVYEQPALISHNGGLNFFLGNNGNWRETMFLRPGLPFRKLVLDAEPADRQVNERNRYWWDRTWKEVGRKPVVWASTLMTKALWSVNDREIPRNEDYRCRTDAGPMAWMAWLPVRYGWVFPLGLLGALTVARRAGPERLLPGLWLALHLPLVLFIVADRYRLATWPVLCLLAAAGLAAAVGWLRAQERPALHPLHALLLPALILPWLPIDPRTGRDEAWCLHIDGNLALMDGRQEEGASLYEQALAVDPEDWGARDFLARTRFDQGDPQTAAALMEPLIAWFPDHFPSLSFMSQVQRALGNRSAAADYMGRAYRVPGERTSTGVKYVRLLLEAGRPEEARAVVAADPALQGHPGLVDMGL